MMSNIKRLSANQLHLVCLLWIIVLFISGTGCSRKETTGHGASAGRLQVVTTLFPLYDFSRIIAGDKAEVRLLLPPGVEPHSFEPRPDDIIRIGKSGLFIYTNRYMEPWAGTILKGVDLKKLHVVDASVGVNYIRVTDGDGHDHGQRETRGGLDPHIWLDFGNAKKIADNILAGFVVADPANAAYFEKNAETLKTKLDDLDKNYREGLASCVTRTFLHGGHYTFGYLAHRYGLNYRSLSGVSSESEPSGARMTAMVRLIRQSGVRYLFAEELLSPRLSETLAAEAGVDVLRLHGAHNLGREDFERGASFIELMEENLRNLQKGLGCRTP